MDITIYKLTNTLNGMGYVGMTKDFERRMAEHRWNNKHKALICKVIHKYGWENFTAEVIEVCDAEVASEREKYWIKKLRTREPYGYNCTDGGFKGTKWATASIIRRSSSIQSSVFPVLAEELNKQCISPTNLAQMVGCNVHTVVAWMYGRNEIKLSSAIKVKEVLGVDMPLEELFAKAPAQQSE